MLTPEELQGLVQGSKVYELTEQLTEDILIEMARLVGDGKYALPSLQWKTWVATSINLANEQAINRIAKYNKQTPEFVRDIFEQAGALSYAYDASVFEDAFKAAMIYTPPIPFKNPQLQAVLEAGIRKTQGELLNFTRTTAKNHYGQLYAAYDRAYMQVSSNAFTVEQAVRNAVHYLADTGMKMVQYDSGYRLHLDTAVRLNLITGINQTCSEMTAHMGDELGGTTVETTAHIGARDTGTGFQNHEQWQGRWFSWRGRNPEYPSFEEECAPGHIQGIHGANCRHSFWFVFPGLSEPAYRREDYQRPPIEYDGKELSYYEATQKQRDLERAVRDWARKKKAAEAAGLDSSMEAGKVKYWRSRLDGFTKHAKLKRQPNRERPIS